VPFTIPNVGDAGFTAQAMVNSTDIGILAAGASRFGVVSGCTVTTTGAANGSVAVAAGVGVIDGVYANITAGNVAISANSSGNPRRDLVVIAAGGTKTSVVGTPGAVPLMPTIPAGNTVLADVYVPNGHTSGSTIAANQITDKRLTVSASDFQAHNVLHYGAVGNSNHTNGGGADDTAAIQAAYTAAQEVGGFGIVMFPGGRTYRITDTIETSPNLSRQSVWTWGVGSLGGNQVVNLPNIVWDGAAGGTMFNNEASGPNLGACLYRNVRFAGRAIAATAIRFGPSGSNFAKIDSGTGLDEVHIGAFTGNGVQCDGIGSTNFWIRGGRWDAIEGYALYMKIASQTFLSIRDVTWDVGATGLGFAHFDGGVHAIAGTANTHYVMCHFDSVHWESGGLVTTIAGATENAGKRGVIRCTIDTNEVIVQHQLKFTNCQILGHNSEDASHALIQMDGGTTNDQRKARLNVKADMMTGFNTGTGASETGDVIWIGNCGLTNPDPGDNYQEFTHRFSGGGVTAGRYPRIWNNTT
jgi:hypothetical protein